jgi:hypothetical protein
MQYQTNRCKLILYADDAVLYYGSKDIKEIESILNKETNAISQWLSNNNLIINLKKGKTEFMRYGSAQKLSKSTHQCTITVNQTKINQPDSYEYLGVTLDKNVLLKQQIDKIYKKASTRLKLLKRIRYNIPPFVAQTIYTSMIQPLTMYCCQILCNLKRTNLDKLQRIQDRAHKIINAEGIGTCPDMLTLRNQRIAVEVYKSLHKIGPACMTGQFTLQSHSINTRGNCSLLTLPKVKSEAGRSMFSFQGALIYNSIDKSIRDEKSFANFKTKIKNFDF